MGKYIPVTVLAAAVLCAAVFIQTRPGEEPQATEIRWTSFGVPHIKAQDEQGLGYGIGYAYARDNLCLLADEVLTVQGERAHFLGAEGKSSAGLDNIRSDFFFKWLNNDKAVNAFLTAQTAETRQLIRGYVAGYNRYLADAKSSSSCAEASWLRPLEEQDLARLIRRLLVEGGLGQFTRAMLAAQSPREALAQNNTDDVFALSQLDDFRLEKGSNAIAVGGAKTETGKGRLLANPHFPWNGGMRFYQMHLTIPGKMDVMGAALPGMPLVNIGFTEHFAWTHTVDTSSHFTLHQLTLDKADPERYVLDGNSQPLRKTLVTIQVREADGSVTQRSHAVYESDLGPVINWPGVLDWNKQHAYVLQDVNLNNDRVLSQWLHMNQAPDLQAFRSAIEQVQGIPWVNTLAVDDQGAALYMNASVVPNLPMERLAGCAIQPLVEKGLPAVDGSRSECNWQADAQAKVEGIVPVNRMPALVRTDFVQNSNDSAWMSNPAAPLEGFSPLISRQDIPLGLRARFALNELSRHKEGPYTEAFLKNLVTDNRVYLADLILDDVLTFCAERRTHEDLLSSCHALAQWDRRANIDSSIGTAYFHKLAAELLKDKGVWREPFDPKNPTQTPRGLAWQKPEVAALLEQALRQSAEAVAAARLPADAKWGDVQVAERNGQLIPIPGGDGHLGIYNAIQSEPRTDGRLHTVGGTSYIQLVSFTENGVTAEGLMAFSQSSEPKSPHFKDQTEQFARQQWHRIPFTEREIEGDPQLTKLSLKATEEGEKMPVQ